MGAWIETREFGNDFYRYLSHPMWVRGLKLNAIKLRRLLVVAPYVGAWIETRFNELPCGRCEVAPYVGAWIETCQRRLPVWL